MTVMLVTVIVIWCCWRSITVC